MTDHALLEKLQDYYARHRALPSLLALALISGSTPERVELQLVKLLEAGFLSRHPEAGYEPAPSFFESGVAASAVPAGIPASDALAGVRESVNLHTYLIRTPSQTVMIPVKGDSMEQAGIHDGDLAIVEIGRAAMPGDIVVARVDGAYTLKTLALNSEGAYFLQPANPAYEDIYPSGEMEIHGVMVGLARRYLH